VSVVRIQVKYIETVLRPSNKKGIVIVELPEEDHLKCSGFSSAFVTLITFHLGLCQVLVSKGFVI